MNDRASHREQLLRYLNGQLDGHELRQLEELLRTDPDVRTMLRELAEQAVMIADLERSTLVRSATKHSPTGLVIPPRPTSRRWTQLMIPIAATLAVVAAGYMVMAALRPIPGGHQAGLRVSRVTGSSQVFGARGTVQDLLDVGAILHAGDAVQTQSCDAWIDLNSLSGWKITIAGNSAVRFLAIDRQSDEIRLENGSLWIDPPDSPVEQQMVIQTPVVTVRSFDAQLDVKSSATESIVRVNEGRATVARTQGGEPADVNAGQQTSVSLGQTGPIVVRVQPQPATRWSADLGRVPDVLLGKWLPPDPLLQARLGAVPLLLPIEGRDPLLLYAVSIAAWRTSDRPVLLNSQSKWIFRGRTSKSHTVRFGFSTQKMQGVFAGKFELDVPASDLAPAGESWQVELPLAKFVPLQPELAQTPDGLELTDVYALTIQHDAGLEVHHMELLPAGPTISSPARQQSAGQ
ncbi:MAG: hypothetical protein U0795_15995 [Pirellulales bacterium]